MVTKDQRNSEARRRYRMGGQQLRRKMKLHQRKYRRQGGSALRAHVHMMEEQHKFRAKRIRREPLQHRARDMT